MNGHRGKVLAVDDSEMFRQMLEHVLKERGYQPVVAGDGQEALEKARSDPPDVVLVDLTLPDIDGFEVCKRLRSDPSTHGVPIVVITGMEQPGFEVMAIDAGADDFISKPIDPLVLDARISLIVKRMRRERLANILTGLPGNVMVDREITSRLSRRPAFCLGYVDIDNFKNFNDKYGYERGDDCLLMTAHLLRNAVRDEGDPEDFIGHLGGDDFIYLTTPEKAEVIGQRIIGDFDGAAPWLYDDDTRKKGFFVAVDRRGEEFKVPITTVSIAALDSSKKDFANSIEMLDIVRALKAYAKGLGGSVFVKERRRYREPGPLPPKEKVAPHRGVRKSAALPNRPKK